MRPRDDLLLLPTSSSYACFLGETPSDKNFCARWLRVMRRVAEEVMGSGVAGSLRGSGEDMMSALGVAGLATLCQRRLKDSGCSPGILRRDICGGRGGGGRDRLRGGILHVKTRRESTSTPFGRWNA